VAKATGLSQQINDGAPSLPEHRPLIGQFATQQIPGLAISMSWAVASPAGHALTTTRLGHNPKLLSGGEQRPTCQCSGHCCHDIAPPPGLVTSEAGKMVSGLILWRANDFHWWDGQRIILIKDLHIDFNSLIT